MLLQGEEHMQELELVDIRRPESHKK